MLELVKAFGIGENTLNIDDGIYCGWHGVLRWGEHVFSLQKQG